MSEQTDTNRIQSNFRFPEVFVRPTIEDLIPTKPELAPEVEELALEIQDTPRGLSLERLKKRGKRILRTYLAIGVLSLAGSIAATEHYKPELKELQRQAIDQVVNHADDYAVSLKTETTREYDNIVHQPKAHIEAPGAFISTNNAVLSREA